jgi:hypothetical protein
MHVGIVTFLKYPGFLNVKYGLYYQFTLEGKNVVIGLNGHQKGVKIMDDNNYHVSHSNKVSLSRPIQDFTKGHIISLGAATDRNIKLVDKDSLQFSVEPDQINKRDVFVIERFYTDFIVIVEFDKFDKKIFDDDNRREQYNRSIIKAFNHFIVKYNTVTNSGNLLPIVSLGKQSNVSYILRQGFFEIKPETNFYQYIKKDTSWQLQPTSFVFEQVAMDGIKGATDKIINGFTEALKEALRYKVTIVEQFLSSSWLEFNKMNYKYSFLEAFLAIEVSVQDYLTGKKAKTNIPQKILDDYSRETGIAYQTNIEIPLTLGTVDTKYNNLLSDINKIRKLRNNIVHSGEEVTAEQTRDAIHKIKEFVSYLKQLQ